MNRDPVRHVNVEKPRRFLTRGAWLARGVKVKNGKAIAGFEYIIN
jgi:hypothetical protein